MPHPRAWLSSTYSAAAEDSIHRTSGNITSHSPSLHVTKPNASDTSCSSAVHSTTSSAASGSGSDDNASLQTLPSIPSIQSLNPPLLPRDTLSYSTSFLCLTELLKANSSSATATALDIDPSSLHLYAASEAKIVVYNLANLLQIDSFAAPSGAGSVKSITLDGRRVFTAHQDGRIRVWTRSSSSAHHRLKTTLPTTGDRLLRLAVPSNYVNVRRHKKRLWIEHADAVSAVAIKNGLLYSVSWDKTLKLWRGSDLRCLESVTAHEDAVNAVAVVANGTVYTGSADRKIRVWAPGLRGHTLVATLERHRSAVNALALSTDGSVLYSGACDRSILVWEREDSADYMVVVGALRGHAKAILCLACAGDLLLSGSSDRTVRIWRRAGEGEGEGEGQGYSCLGLMEGHASGVRSLAAARMPAGEEEEEYRICSGSLDGKVRVWQVRLSARKRSDLSLCVTRN